MAVAGPRPVSFKIQLENTPMSNPSKELRETESALRSVIETLIDGQEDFRNIGEQLKDAALKDYFLAESLTRAQLRGVLESILHQEGVHDVQESGTPIGTVRRAWGDLKSTLGGGDRALLATAEKAESAATDVYTKAIDGDLPLPIRQVLVSQADHISSSLQFIRTALGATK